MDHNTTSTTSTTTIDMGMGMSYLGDVPPSAECPVIKDADEKATATILPLSPSTSSLASSSSSAYSDNHGDSSSDNDNDLEEESPGTTPGAGSENGDDTVDPFTTFHSLPPPPSSSGREEDQNPEYILVTGGLGYIGSHTTLELLKQGYNVIVVDNLTNCFASTKWRIQHLAQKHCAAEGRPLPKLHFHKLDYQSHSMRLLLEQYTYSPAASSTASSRFKASSPFDLTSEFDMEDSSPAETENDTTRVRSQIAGVIHFAAYKSVEESISNPLAYYDNNVCGLVGFLRLLAEFNIRNFIFSSSATIYGSKANSERPLKEEDVVHFPASSHSNPGNRGEKDGEVQGLTCAYARTKFFCEAILADLARSEPSRWRITCLRYFNPVGCDPSGLLGESPRNRPTNLFPVVAEVLAGKREKLNVFGTDWPTRDGTAIRDYVHVGDIAKGHVAALATFEGLSARGGSVDCFSKDSSNGTKDSIVTGTDTNTEGTTDKQSRSQQKRNDKGLGFKTYNLGSGTGTSVLEIVDSLSKAAGKPVPVEWTARRPGDVGFCVASTERASRELGWYPRETIAQSARDLWNYIRRVSPPSSAGLQGKPGQPGLVAGSVPA